MKNLIYLSIVALAALLFTNADSVQAQGCGAYGGYMGGWTGGNFGFLESPFHSPYASGRVPTPPYFALHPPVYYSKPVPRTYGYSPFAYPASVMTPEVIEPAALDNPHVEPTEASAKLNHMASHEQALEILNPFARQRNSKLVSRDVK